jgi:D-sedoheptulose 7-phosphate isomerase
MIKTIKNAKHVYVCGNGGSASTAEHLVNDLFSVGIKAYCLNSNVSIITMIANDYGYEFIFSKQLELYAESGDMLITISCSGVSPNILNAIYVAEKLGLELYKFETGEDYEETENSHLRLVHSVKRKLK